MNTINRLAAFYMNSFRDLPLLSWILLLTIFINAIGQMFAFFSTLYLNSIGFDAEFIGIIIACYNVGGLAGTYIGGVLSEKFGVMTLPSSLLASSLLLLGMVVVNDGILIGILVFILGASHNIFKPISIYLLVHNVLDTDKARLLGLRRVSLNLGVGIGTIIGGYVSTKGYSYVFLLESMFSALGFCIFLACYFHQQKYAPVIRSREQIVINNNSIDNSKKILTLYIVSFLNVMVFAQLFITYPLYLEQYCNFNGQSFARLFTLNTLIIVLIEVPLINMMKNISQYKLLMLGTVCLCNGLSVFAMWDSAIIIYSSAVLWTLGEIMFFPSILALIISLSRINRGKIIGFYQTTYSLGMLCGSAIGGFVYKVYHPTLLWYSCGIISIISFFMIFMIRPMQQKNISNSQEA